MTDRFLKPDVHAGTLARRLTTEARNGALGTLRNGLPFVTRIALAPNGTNFLTLVSDLAPHTQALRENCDASLLIGEPGKGDPLAHPRMTIEVRASFLEKTDDLIRGYLDIQPKAQMYIRFSDFHLVLLTVGSALLNGGFGKAYEMSRSDLGS